MLFAASILFCLLGTALRSELLAPGLDGTPTGDCSLEAEYGPRHRQYARLGRWAVLEAAAPLEEFLLSALTLAKAAVVLRLALVLNLSSHPEVGRFLQPNSFDWGIRGRFPTAWHYTFPHGSLLLPGNAILQFHFPSMRAALAAVAVLAEPVTAAQLDAGCLFHLMFRWTPALRQLYATARQEVRLPQHGEHSAWHAHFPHRSLAYGAALQDANVTSLCRSYAKVFVSGPRRVLLVSSFYQFKWSCGSQGGGHGFQPHFVDLGLDGPRSSAHLDAFFLDLLFLMNAVVLIHNGASLARLAAEAANMTCTAPQGARFLSRCLRKPTADVWGEVPASSPPFPPLSPLLEELSRPVPYFGVGERFTPGPEAARLRAVQQLIHDWQNPPPSECHRAKFLLYRTMSHTGMGSNIHIAAAALGIALCLGRILVVGEAWGAADKWVAGTPCRAGSTWLDCYFQPLSSCATESFDTIPRTCKKTSKCVLVNPGYWLPKGPCGFCNHTNPAFVTAGSLHRHLLQLLPPQSLSLGTGHLVRYLLRPQPWFAERIRAFLEGQAQVVAMLRSPIPFAAVHARYGDKAIEAPQQSLRRYIAALEALNVTRAFISTETEAVLRNLTVSFQHLTFFNISYPRREKDFDSDRFHGLVVLFSNLLVALCGDAMVGTDSSNWSRLLHELLVTSRRPHRRYISLDAPQWPLCFPR